METQTTLLDLLYADATFYRDQLLEKLGNDPRKVLIEFVEKHRLYVRESETAHLPEEQADE